jgi:glycosyltransferase involved in cell wall biosynthesis
VPPGAGAAELVTVHDFGPWRFPDLVTKHARAYPRLVERAIHRGADLHVVSDFVASEAVELLGAERQRLHVIHNGFDRGRRGVAGRGLELAGGHPYVVAIGTIEPRKDLPTLVAAMAAVEDAVPDLRLVVAGADGWGTGAFEAALERWGSADRVVRLGYVTDQARADLLAGATCLAYPSIYEGFGLPPLEAMAASTPVVTTTAGALPEVCGDAAWYAEPTEPERIFEAARRLLTEPELAAEHVRKGHARARQFTWRETARSTLIAYQKATEPVDAGEPRLRRSL